MNKTGLKIFIVAALVVGVITGIVMTGLVHASTAPTNSFDDCDYAGEDRRAHMEEFHTDQEIAQMEEMMESGDCHSEGTRRGHMGHHR